MSFRTRLTLFFVLIVVVPMAALGVVVSRLVDDSERGQAEARASAHLSAAMTLYERSATLGLRAAGVVAGDRALAAALADGDTARARARARALVTQLALARLVVAGAASDAPDDGGVRGASDTPPLLALGTRTAVAAGTARIRGSETAISASVITARDYVDAVAAAPGVEAVVRRGTRTLASTLPDAKTAAGAAGPAAAAAGAAAAGAAGPNAAAAGAAAADNDTAPLLAATTTSDTTTAPHRLTHAGTDWIAASFRAADLGGARDTITILTNADAAATAASTTTTTDRDRRVACALLGGFLVLGMLGALLVSRQLQAQVGRFLSAARRIGAGDFDTKVPTHGSDEFAALGHEFNRMSSELEQRIDDLDRERGRLRDSIQRVGETFASNLDRHALLVLGTETAIAAVEADGGRATVTGAEPVALGDTSDPRSLEALLAAAEARARAAGAPAEATSDDGSAFASPIPRAREDAPPHGLLAVVRRGRRPFTDEERALLGSLVAQTGISLENVELHDRVARQAVTDELTGLFNHRRFQEVMDAEIAAAHRYDRPLGLVMVDVDNFKSVNDTYGHQQGDLVLKAVAAVVQESSREIDEPARYGGEEMAIALPQTDLDGAYAIAERVRSSVAALAVPRLDGNGVLRVTVSCGVAASASAAKDQLVASADAALYEAKRSGKNRTVRGCDPAAVPLSAE
jgi:diguanylate cyclase (GGDEF)-like protein